MERVLRLLDEAREDARRYVAKTGEELCSLRVYVGHVEDDNADLLEANKLLRDALQRIRELAAPWCRESLQLGAKSKDFRDILVIAGAALEQSESGRKDPVDEGP